MKAVRLALVATIGSTLFPLAASAADDRAAITIEYRDLNLASPQGQAALDQRLNQAARKVCGLDQARTGTRLAAREGMQCYREARAKAKQQVAAAIAAQQLGG